MGCVFSSKPVNKYTEIQKKIINTLSSFLSKEKVESIKMINNRIEVCINGINVTIGFTESDCDVYVSLRHSYRQDVFIWNIKKGNEFDSNTSLISTFRHFVK